MVMEVNSSATTGKPKAKIKGNKKAEKEKDSKGKASKGKSKDVVVSRNKFEGHGLNFKCKLFGFVEVPGPRGDKSSVQAILRLKQQAKQQKKGANEHKLKIVFNITLQGIKIINEKTQTVAHEHQIHKISFISHDPEDRHVFGYIYSPPRSAVGNRQYFLFAIKSEKPADAITSQLYELFQVVYKMQENRKAQNKEIAPQNQKKYDKPVQPLEPLQDKMLLEMSSKLGGEQHQTDEHLYAIPSDPPTAKVASSESEQNEKMPVKNGVDVAKSEISLSSNSASFTQDRLSSSETDVNEQNKEIDTVSQIFSDNIFAPSINDDFDTVTSSTMPVEPKSVDSVQFEAEFPPFGNGFTDAEQEGHAEDDKSSVPMSISVDQIHIKAPISERKKGEADVRKSLSSTGSINSNDDSQRKKDILSTNEDNEHHVSSSFSSNNDSSKMHQRTSNEELSHSSSFDKGAKENDSYPTDFFEASFETETNKSTDGKINKDVFSSFSGSTEELPKNDPFSNDSTAEHDLSTSFGTFSEDDPFSSQGGTNSQVISDPFAGNDNMFKADFGSLSGNDPFEEGDKGDFFSLVNRKPEENVSNDGDVFEAVFEAKMEDGFNQNVNEQQYENQNETKDNDHTQVQENINRKAETNQETQHLFKNDTHKSDNNFEDNAAKNIAKTVEMVNDEEADNHSNVNTFDLSTNDDYVTLKTAAVNRPLSPTEFTPPPLPPRSSFPMFEPPDSPDSPVAPKEPPALPPRPTTNQFLNPEVSLRKPPELPPRVDLENVDVKQLSTYSENTKTETTQGSEIMFSTNFDSFDFNNPDNDVDATFQHQESVDFDIGDPFKDPFHGADPFQTPLASDPFSSPATFSRDYKHGNKDFDPFSDDDPFATTLTFDQVEDEHSKNDKEFEGFPDFSTLSE